MSNTYNKSYASLQTIKHDTTVLDAQRIFIRTPQDSISSRTDIIDYIGRKDTEVATNANNSINDIKNRLNGYDSQINNISSLNKRVTKIENRGLSIEGTELIPTLSSMPSSTGELNAIRVSVDRVPHNVPLKGVEVPIPTANSNLPPVYVAICTVIDGVKKLVGRSVNSVVLAGGTNAVWTLDEDFIVPDGGYVEIYFVQENTGISNNGANYPGFHVACYVINGGSDSIRYGSNNDWYARDVYLNFRKTTYTSIEDSIVDGLFNTEYLRVADSGSEFCECNAINYSSTRVPHNVVINEIEFPVLSSVTTPTYLAAWTIDPSNVKTYVGMSDEAITWESGNSAIWTFINNPITILDGHKLELYIVTTPPAEGEIEGTAPGYYLKVYCATGSGTTRYNGKWTANRDVRTYFRRIGHLNDIQTRIETLESINHEEFATKEETNALTTRIETLESTGGTGNGGTSEDNPDHLTKEVADTLYADKATTENAIGNLFSSAQFESAADSTQECECNAINYTANNIPHNVAIDTIEFTVLSSNIIPTYLAAWIINPSNVKTYIGMSDTAITWTQGGKAIWTFTNNPINIPDTYRLEIYIVTTPPASGAIEGTAPGHYLKVNCKTGTGTTRYNGSWTKNRDVRTSFRKIGYIESLENQINRLEERIANLESQVANAAAAVIPL